MKISYKLVGEAGPSFTGVIVDEGARPVVAAGVKGSAVLAEFAGSAKPANQQELLAQAPDASFREPRGNVVVSLPLACNVEYTSKGAAVKAIRTFQEDLLGTKFHLKVEEGAETQYYNNAVCDSYDWKQTGVSVDHVFRFTSDRASAALPTP